MRGIHCQCLLIPPLLLLHHCGPLSMTKWAPQAWLCKPLIPPPVKGLLGLSSYSICIYRLLFLLLFIEINTWHFCIKNGPDFSHNCLLVNRKKLSHTVFFQVFFRKNCWDDVHFGVFPWCFYPNGHFFIMFERQMTSNTTSKLNFLEKFSTNNDFQKWFW